MTHPRPDRPSPALTALPDAPGVGYKPQHYSAILSDPAPVQWLEIHAENYMGDGGRPIAQLKYLAERFPICCTAWACPSVAKARLTRPIWRV